MDLDVNSPFTTNRALKLGLTRRRLYGREFQQLFRGSHVSSTTRVTTALRLEAAMQLRTDAEFASHHTAAELLGAVVPTTPDVHLGTVLGLRSVRDGIVQHRYSAAPRTVRRRGFDVTDPAQTMADLARVLSLVDLVIAGDSLVRATPGALAAIVDHLSVRRFTGKAKAVRAARLIRPGVDSAQETRLRLLMILAGLPEPSINITLRDEDGEIVHRIDLGYVEQQLAIEYDGRQHIAREAAWELDLRRREQLMLQGWTPLTFVAADIYRHPDRTLERIRDAMKGLGMSPPPIAQAWQRHFR